MASSFGGLSHFASRHRVPLMFGLVGLTAVAAYNRRRAAPPPPATGGAPSFSDPPAPPARRPRRLSRRVRYRPPGCRARRQVDSTSARPGRTRHGRRARPRGHPRRLAGRRRRRVAGSALGNFPGALVDVVTSPTGLVVTPHRRRPRRLRRQLRRQLRPHPAPSTGRRYRRRCRRRCTIVTIGCRNILQREPGPRVQRGCRTWRDVRHQQPDLVEYVADRLVLSAAPPNRRVPHPRCGPDPMPAGIAARSSCGSGSATSPVERRCAPSKSAQVLHRPAARKRRRR